MKNCIYLLIFMCSTLYPKNFKLPNKTTFTRIRNSLSPNKPIQPGRIVFITGSCSAGKSSLTKLVAKELNAQTFAFDEYVLPRVLTSLVQQYVGKPIASFITMILIRNFFTIINFFSEERKYAFQKKFYDELSNGLATKPMNKMYKEIRNAALSGQNVVVDSLTHLGESVDCLSSLAELKDLNVMFVLVYCPWKNLVERIEHRNTSKDKKNRRELDWALSNFVHYFDTSAHYQAHSIDSIDGKYVKEILAVHSQPTYKKRGLKIMDETKRITLDLFKTDGPQYICPRLAYDLIINTKDYTSVQASSIVLDFFKAYNPSKKFIGLKTLSCTNAPSRAPSHLKAQSLIMRPTLRMMA